MHHLTESTNCLAEKKSLLKAALTKFKYDLCQRIRSRARRDLRRISVAGFARMQARFSCLTSEFRRAVLVRCVEFGNWCRSRIASVNSRKNLTRNRFVPEIMTSEKEENLTVIHHKSNATKYPSKVSDSACSISFSLLSRPQVGAESSRSRTRLLITETLWAIFSVKIMLQAWRVFRRLTSTSGATTEPKKVFCKLCYEKDKKLCGFGGRTGTETLLRHISREHPREFFFSTEYF